MDQVAKVLKTMGSKSLLFDYKYWTRVLRFAIIENDVSSIKRILRCIYVR